jgi:hypothetical protein
MRGDDYWGRLLKPLDSCAARIRMTAILARSKGRRTLIAYYLTWHAGHPAREQCEGYTFNTPLH